MARNLLNWKNVEKLNKKSGLKVNNMSESDDFSVILSLAPEQIFDYQKFGYRKYEWDNVPQILPRFSFHLETYVKGLSEMCGEIHSRETTMDLR